MQNQIPEMGSTLLNNERVYFFNSCLFEVNGVKFKIIGTAATGTHAHDTIHTVKNLATGECSNLKMTSLIDIFKRNGKI